MTSLQRLRSLGRRGLRSGACLAAVAATGLSLLAGSALTSGTPARAQSTPSIWQYTWGNDRNSLRELYHYVSDTQPQKRAEYYLLVEPKDRGRNGILKLRIEVPKTFDAALDPKRMKFCVMQKGGMTKRTGCKEVIPATIEVSADGRRIEVIPETPVSGKPTVGLYMNVFNPSAAFHKFTVESQAPGMPIPSLVGQWTIQIGVG